MGCRKCQYEPNKEEGCVCPFCGGIYTAIKEISIPEVVVKPTKLTVPLKTVARRKSK
jgi:hypothetical protein